MFFFRTMYQLFCFIFFIFRKSEYEKVSFDNLVKFFETEITEICNQTDIPQKEVIRYTFQPMCNHIQMIRNKRLGTEAHDPLYAFREIDFYFCFADMLSSYHDYWQDREFYIEIFNDRHKLLKALCERGYEKGYFSKSAVENYLSLSSKFSKWNIPTRDSDALKTAALLIFFLYVLKAIFLGDSE
ncbi:MAG: hypothetical protein IJN28_05405 [Selenomonadales bacterium]|nr:hypothetical protein [Selenomonadales bacterium]